MRKLRLAALGLLLLTAAGVAPTHARQKSQAPFWGGLTAGRYRVGFRTVYRFDRARTWRVTRGYEKPFAPDLNGRPIRISVWYPAVPGAQARRIHFADYVRPAGPKEFDELNGIVEAREKGSSVYSARWSDVLRTFVNAYADAKPATGRFPLVLYAGSLNSAAATTVFVAAEFLASHGYVVATVPVLGPTNEETEQGQKAADRERVVEDLEFAWSVLRGQADVARADGGRLDHEDAATPPPSAVEFADIIAGRGFDAAVALVERFRRELPGEVVVDADTFNGVGYRLMAERRFPEAIGIMRLVVYAYPDSANAADSLADAYIAAGQKDLARATLQQALKVIARDSGLSEANKQYMTKVEQSKLARLKP